MEGERNARALRRRRRASAVRAGAARVVPTAPAAAAARARGTYPLAQPSRTLKSARVPCTLASLRLAGAAVNCVRPHPPRLLSGRAGGERGKAVAAGSGS